MIGTLISKKVWIVLGIFVGVTVTCQGQDVKPRLSIEIAESKRTIWCGDPIGLELKLTFAEPRLSPWTGASRDVVKLETPELHVRPQGTRDDSTITYTLLPIRCFGCDEAGLQYMARVLVWWHSRKNGQRENEQLVFGTPGTYELTIKGERDCVCNSVSATVEPTPLVDKGLALLPKREDFFFLAYGEPRGPERIEPVKTLLKRYPGTCLGQMAGARLGIEYAKQLEEKYPASMEFFRQYLRGEIAEPLVDTARSHLLIGYHLPDALPIREELLTRLAPMELFKGHGGKTLSLIDELGTKYPHGKHGRRAKAFRARFEVLINNQLASSGKMKPESDAVRPLD